jgi:hypothetical protein
LKSLLSFLKQRRWWRSCVFWRGKVKGNSVPNSFMYFFLQEIFSSFYVQPGFCWLFSKLGVGGVCQNDLQLRTSSNLKTENNTLFHRRSSSNQTSRSVGRFETQERWSEVLFHSIQASCRSLVINIYDVFICSFVSGLYFERKVSILL